MPTCFVCGQEIPEGQPAYELALGQFSMEVFVDEPDRIRHAHQNCLGNKEISAPMRDAFEQHLNKTIRVLLQGAGAVRGRLTHVGEQTFTIKTDHSEIINPYEKVDQVVVESDPSAGEKTG